MEEARRIFTAEYLRDLGTAIFEACGAPQEEAAIVADELVEADIMGFDSHGIIRCIWYVREVLDGRIKPGGQIRVVKETPSTAILDCGFNFGPVSAVQMVDIVCEKAKKSSIACVVSQNGHHVSRLGSYVQKVAEHGMIGLAVANTSKTGHYVVPWGGREARLATNPLAYGVPTSGDPVVLDMSTSMISEGKIRVLMHQGKPLPSGCIVDADGNPSTDPKAFYGPPRGAIMPLGSELGYKGFGLALLVEVLGGVLAGMDSSVEHQYLNGTCLIAIDPDAFCGRHCFIHLTDRLSEYIASTPPASGFDEVVLPGTLEFRMREKRLAEGIPLDRETWRQIVKTAELVGLSVEEAASDDLEPPLAAKTRP
ncbi:MAG: Ldh family oxidoreductase [Armatimonadetes bacterium]|nr:Ldh family oxidoreductase [Armatimonadota bacterium]